MEVTDTILAQEAQNPNEEVDVPEIWINLLNHGSYELIGKEVMKALLSSDAKKEGHREIRVTGS